MQTIWKFPLRITFEQSVSMPRVRRLLTVQLQDGIPQLWAIVNPETKLEEVSIICRGTGHPSADSYIEHNYLGTVQLNGFVWHWFVGAFIDNA